MKLKPQIAVQVDDSVLGVAFTALSSSQAASYRFVEKDIELTDTQIVERYIVPMGHAVIARWRENQTTSTANKA